MRKQLGLLRTSLSMQKETRRQFSRKGLPVPKVTAWPSKERLGLYDFAVTRERGGFRLHYHPEARGQRFFHFMRLRVPSYIYVIAAAAPRAERIICNGSDGERASFADISHSSFQGTGQALVLDFYFFDTYGFAEDRAAVENANLAWEDRSDEIVWRGNPSGHGLLVGTPDLGDNGLVNQRLRMAYAARDTEIDFKFVTGFTAGDSFEALGFMGEKIAEQSWIGRKYAIDIDGYAATWSNLFRRLIYGCCVLKVDSQIGFELWYHKLLKPFEHYVPIARDLSDLQEKLDWVRSHPKKARDIAAAGQAVARSITWERATAESAEAINAL